MRGRRLCVWWEWVLAWLLFASSIAEVGADPVAGAGYGEIQSTRVFGVVQRGRRAAGRPVLPGAVLAGGLSDVVI